MTHDEQQEHTASAAADARPNKHGRDLTTGSIPRHLIAFSLPMLAGSTLQTAYSLVNAIWVGKFLGKAELAAVTVSFPIFFLLMAVAGGLTMAASILVSQYAGARNWSQVRHVTNTSTLVIGLISILLTVIGEVFSPSILRAMSTPPEVLPLAVGYMRILLFTLPLNFVIFLYSSTLRGVGDSTTPLYFQAIFLVVNAVLDPLLIFGTGFLPRLGLNGTAWATLVTLTGATASIIIFLQVKKHIVAPDWRRLRADWPTAWAITKIGFPSVIQQSLVSIGMVFVIGIVNKFGESAAAAFGAASRIDQIAFMPAMTMSMAVSTLAGQNIGAGRFHRVREVFWWGLLIGGGITLLVSAFAVSYPRLLTLMFVNGAKDPDVLRMSVDYLRIVGVCYVFFAVMFVSNGIINGAGHTFVTTIISLVGLWMVRVPLALYLSSHLHSVTGIWYAMGISFGTTMIVSLAYYFSGYWKRAVVKPHAPAPAAEAQLDEPAPDPALDGPVG